MLTDISASNLRELAIDPGAGILTPVFQVVSAIRSLNEFSARLHKVDRLPQTLAKQLSTVQNYPSPS